jgi:hypothetical protein
MNRNVIRLTESDLHHIIKEAVEQVIFEGAEQEIEEGWLGDKWNQTKSAAKTMFQNNPDASLADRFKGAKANWKTQGELNDINSLKQALSDFVDAGQLSPQMTIAQLIGGKYNGNKFGRMTGMAANRRGQISRRGGEAY